jgi:GH25 family lysozyme M1 (1,4-beta-N-acetylmuramidase)
MSDDAPATLPFHLNAYASEKAIIDAAKERMTANLQAFDDTFINAAGKSSS